MGSTHTQKLLAAAMAGCVAGITLPAVTHAMAPLSASVRYEVEYKDVKKPAPVKSYDGFIRDENSGQPVAGVNIGIPQMNFKTVTDDNGGFNLPDLPATKPVIIGVTKDGYVPRSATLQGKPGQGFHLKIEKNHRVVVLDESLRHLGDGSYANTSAGALDFKTIARGPSLTKKFRLDGDVPGDKVTLNIGSIIGLDTARSQALGQSRFHKTASPMTVTLNGQIVGIIGANGDNHKIRISKNVLNPTGVNHLQIATGHHRPDGTYVDYDDVELMFLTLEF